MSIPSTPTINQAWLNEDPREEDEILSLLHIVLWLLSNLLFYVYAELVQVSSFVRIDLIRLRLPAWLAFVSIESLFALHHGRPS